ncbi:hypothetical protein BOX15_Mlig004065g2 [Macrostomum lignano]|uniref:Neur_chan_LBD domain-containing protein n=2 Tax=Macrostomum lignano TaxID=282301 RepID=A0A1I8I0T1_9PLAT|nr:hypothetical protein BOX15_Mlig004065g2 [Macrostomum lignano]
MAPLQNAGRCWYQAWNSWLALLPLTALLLLSGAVKPTACDVDPALDQLYRRFYTNREGYKYARPVANVSEPVIMYMNLSLVQLMNVDEKNQIISLNLWVYQEWHDPFFRWDPGEYGGISKIILPSDGLWTPDVVLYSNTGTNWDLSATSTRVKVNNKGLVVWKPPITYDSSCDINVEFFPFDTQDCKLKMGTWTYHGLHIDMRHVAQKVDDNGRNRRNFDNCESDIDYAIDLADYVESAEWDLMRVSATRNIVKYACCVEPYLDITFLVTFRRQPLFYGTNLIAPCIAISCLTSFVFLLPSDTQEKMTLSTFILLALTVFLLLVFDLTPTTSLVVPLITKYLLFTMILISLSLFVSTVVLNVRYSPPDIYRVPPWAKRLFLQVLPGPLMMDRPNVDDGDGCEAEDSSETALFQGVHDDEGGDSDSDAGSSGSCSSLSRRIHRYSQPGASRADRECLASILSALRGVRSIAKRIRDSESVANTEEEWKYIALILDRIFLYCFGLSSVVGMLGIFLQAPTLTDNKDPLRASKFLEYESNINFTRRCGVGYQATS